MQTLFQKFMSWWTRFEYRYLIKDKAVKKGSFFDAFFNIRRAQAIQSSPKRVLWVGNSRIHGGEPLINVLPDTLDLGVSGSKLEDWIDRGVDTISPAMPIAVVEDLGGNNFLAGQDVDHVFALKQQWIMMLSKITKHILVLEVVYLGPGHDDVNAKLVDFNNRIAALPNVSIIRLNDMMAPQGVMLPQFDAGDHIHHSPLAYTAGYMPRVQQRLAELGVV